VSFRGVFVLNGLPSKPPITILLYSYYNTLLYADCRLPIPTIYGAHIGARNIAPYNAYAMRPYSAYATMPLFVHITPIQASYTASLCDSPIRIYYAYMALMGVWASQRGNFYFNFEGDYISPTIPIQIYKYLR